MAKADPLDFSLGSECEKELSGGSQPMLQVLAICFPLSR